MGYIESSTRAWAISSCKNQIDSKAKQQQQQNSEQWKKQINSPLGCLSNIICQMSAFVMIESQRKFEKQLWELKQGTWGLKDLAANGSRERFK